VRGTDSRHLTCTVLRNASRLEGASIEAPKAPSGVSYGEGCPLPKSTRGSGERRELP